MQILAETDYQNLYRITDGVLLVVNKFRYIDYSSLTNKYYHIYIYKKKTGKYHKGCQDCLKVLKEPYYDDYVNITIPKGTVLYGSEPIEIETDKSKWKYQIKTTGEMFSGNVDKIKTLLNEIMEKLISNSGESL